MTDPRTYIGILGRPHSFYRANSLARSHGRSHIDGESVVCCIPKVYAWPFTVDDNGQSFPSGLLGVSATELYSMTEAGSLGDTMWAVPDTLPSGYTSRSVTDHNVDFGNAGDANLKGQYGPFLPNGNGIDHRFRLRGWGWETNGTTAPQAPRIMTATGLTSYPWMPEQLGKQSVVTSPASRQYISHYGKSTGIRYYRVNCTTFNPAGGYSATQYFTYRIRVGYYTGGGPGVTQSNGVGGTQWVPPDTIIYENTCANGATLDTGYLTDTTYPDFHATLGTRRCYLFFQEVFASQFSDGTGGTAWHNMPTTPLPPGIEYMGYRTGVPFPFTVFGEGNLVAPGGVVPGVIPGYP